MKHKIGPSTIPLHDTFQRKIVTLRNYKEKTIERNKENIAGRTITSKNKVVLLLCG